jgi:hypothetical protein
MPLPLSVLDDEGTGVDVTKASRQVILCGKDRESLAWYSFVSFNMASTHSKNTYAEVCFIVVKDGSWRSTKKFQLLNGTSDT